MLKTTSKRVALLVLAVMVSLSWVQSGRTVASCLIERGIDPLDILKIEVKHNVFIAIDNSGSMNNRVDGDALNRSRLDVAKDSLERVITGVGGGVNWGFFYTAKQDDNANGDDDPAPWGCAINPPVATEHVMEFYADGSLKTGDGSIYDFGNPPGGSRQDNCVGIEQQDMTLPVACGNNDTMQTILDQLRPASQGGLPSGAGTANAPSLDQVANMIANNYMGASRPPGQKNIIIYLSDGAEDCACEIDPDGDDTTLPDFIELPPTHVGFEASPTEDTAVLRVDGTPGTPVFEDFATFGSSPGFRAAYSAGVMARHALSRIDPLSTAARGTSSSDTSSTPARGPGKPPTTGVGRLPVLAGRLVRIVRSKGGSAALDRPSFPTTPTSWPPSWSMFWLKWACRRQHLASPRRWSAP